MSGDNETLNAGGSSTPGQDATTVGNAWANMILGGDAGSPSDGEDTGAISGGSGNDQQADNGGSASTDFDDFDYDALFADDDPEAPEGNSGAPAPATPPAAPGTSEERGPVPYDRFREVNERAKAAQQLEARLAAWGPVIERFESEGFSNAHHFTGRTHFWSKDRINARELIEWKYCFLDRKIWRLHFRRNTLLL